MLACEKEGGGEERVLEANCTVSFISFCTILIFCCKRVFFLNNFLNLWFPGLLLLTSPPFLAVLWAASQGSSVFLPLPRGMCSLGFPPHPAPDFVPPQFSAFLTGYGTLDPRSHVVWFLLSQMWGLRPTVAFPCLFEISTSWRAKKSQGGVPYFLISLTSLCSLQCPCGLPFSTWELLMLRCILHHTFSGSYHSVGGRVVKNAQDWWPKTAWSKLRSISSDGPSALGRDGRALVGTFALSFHL